MFTLFGQPGCGKTHIARKLHAYARAIAVTSYFAGGWGGHRIPSNQFVSWPQVCDGFKNGQFATLEDLLRVDFLALDDIGAEYDPSKMCTEKLCQILSARERKFTVVTTNFLPDQWIEKFDARIADRLMRNSVVVDMSQVPSFSTLPPAEGNEL